MKKVLFLIEISALLMVHYLINDAAALNCGSEPTAKEAKLKNHLLCDYDQDSGPDSLINVTAALIVESFAFNRYDGSLTVSGWLNMSWTDEHLVWEPAEHDGIKSFVESSLSIWQPDISLHNNHITSNINCNPTNCRIKSNGTVICIPSCMFAATCIPDYYRWPFDKQVCHLLLGGYAYYDDVVPFIFTLLKTTIEQNTVYSENMEWKIIENTTISAANSLVFLKLERHAGVYTIYIFIPAFSLMLLNLLSLWVDTENYQRIILLALSVSGHWIYMQHLYSVIPHNGDTVPDLLIYFRDSLLLSLILIVNTIIVHRMTAGSKQTPKLIERITTYMDNNRIGQLFLTQSSEQLYKNEDSKVEPKSARKTFGNIIDRILFVLLSIVYVIMMLDLLLI
ncbi:neuronal acetylcholine receptor subunit beta-3-like [Contarinia nasturtii]|uniref:neuronal acetylcholine receptor subunit beta-3-like n=1 Tax=Contarinia nasturtii TaxID=265458 RepID=UPI0012D3CFE5|nr:neuronal acetylcholine receptor subunit beta-3-like [Contarinia nasturtii]